MPQYVLRVEGVNYAGVIDDTDDLSTRRGGGLMLLYAVRQLAESFPALTRRATGASIGLFTLDAADDAAAEAVAEQVRQHFRDGDLEYPLDDAAAERGPLSLRHGTFVVDVVPTGESTEASVEQATAANRWRQWQEPTVSLTGLWNPADGECWQNCVRPAKPGLRLPKDRSHDVCESVYWRHEYGRGQRQRFYRDLIGKAAKFTHTFEEIGGRETLERRGQLQPMDNKLAVFYADGNGFGKIGQEKLKKGMDSYRAWSDALQDHHKTLLAELVSRATPDQGWKNDGAIRLETLLWGGDEIIWVMPAWKGWELAEWFFDYKHQVPGHDQPLTYAAGLVFCATKTPIHNVIKLAKRLGDAAKAARKPAHGLAYEVLESFDDITGDWLEHRNRWLPASRKAAAGGADPLTIDPAQTPAFWNALKAVAAAPDFPMRQLYMLAHAWRAGEDIGLYGKRLLEKSGVKAELETVLGAFNADSGWLHLLQMLPYIPVREDAA